MWLRWSFFSCFWVKNKLTSLIKHTRSWATTIQMANNIRANLYGNLILTSPEDIIRYVAYKWMFIMLEQNYTAFQSYLHLFQFLWDSLERSPFFSFWFVVSLLIFSKMLWWQVKFQSSWNASVPILKITNPKKCVFPVCFFFPSSFCRLVYNKRDSWIMTLDRKYAISRHSQYFVAAGESMQQTLGEEKTRTRGSTDMLVAPVIC